MILTGSVNEQRQKGILMNDRFYALPEDKQKRIINAGFRVFSGSSYKKSPVQEIALDAGISKSLLFFYFKNKKDLYLFLWNKVEELVSETIRNNKIPQDADLFDTMYISLVNKAQLLEEYPDILNFSVKAYYEDDPEVKDDIRKVVTPYTSLTTSKTMPQIDPSVLKKGIDPKKMYQQIYLASEGYMWRMSQGGNIDADKMIAGYKELIDTWKELFLK